MYHKNPYLIQFSYSLQAVISSSYCISILFLLIIRCFSSMGKKSSERVLTIPVGNATNSTELSYEFEIKDSVKPRPQGLIK